MPFTVSEALRARLDTKLDDCREEQVVYTLLLSTSRDAEKTIVVTKNGFSIIQEPDISREAQTPTSRHEHDVAIIFPTEGESQPLSIEITTVFVSRKKITMTHV